jgi:hypothetical protein
VDRGLAIDDDPAALGPLERQLRERYSSSYGIIGTRSPDEALAILTRLSEACEELALVLAAQWRSRPWRRLSSGRARCATPSRWGSQLAVPEIVSA